LLQGMMEPGMMLFSNMLVGAVQFRTVRVQPDDCSKFHADKISESRNLSSINHFLGGGSAGGAGGGVCYPDFYEMRTGVATDAYGERTPGVPCSDNSSATCRYTHSWHNSSLKGSTAFARSTGMTENFGKGGYTVELPRDRAGAVATLAQLEQDFLGQPTRTLAVSFNVYNVNADIFIVFQANFEFHSTGHIEPFARIAPVQLMDNYFFVKTLQERVCFWAVVVITSCFLIWELLELFVKRLVYFNDLWNVYEILDMVRKTPLFEPFIYKNEHFTKTGSGQT
jgi:hypothetical protein